MKEKTINEKTKIAPKNEGSESWTVKEWLDAKKGKHWNTMIQIFKDRINGRYLNFIKELNGQAFSGFAVMALGCPLLETLHQFYKGIESSDKAKFKCGHRMTNSEFYVQFLTESSFVFQDYFKDLKHAKMFYDHFRCGLAHQAETKGGSKIRRKKGSLLFESTIGGLIVYREGFVDALEREIDKYVECLEKNTTPGYRDRFIRKMDFICRVPFEELEN